MVDFLSLSEHREIQPANNAIEALYKHILMEQSFSSLYYYDPLRSNCLSETLLQRAQDKVHIVIRDLAIMPLSQFVSSDLLVVACLPAHYREDLISLLAQSLSQMAEARTIIEVATKPSTNSKDESALAALVLRRCFHNDMLNVALLYQNFAETLRIYSYAAFPVFEVLLQVFNVALKLYPDKLANQAGHAIRTQPDLSEPNTILYYDVDGRARISGYVWLVLKAFAAKHNACLELIAEPVAGRVLTHIDVLDLARKRAFDIAASIQPMSFRIHEHYNHYSYPIICDSWCTMLPMETPLTVPELFNRVMFWDAVLLLGVLYILLKLLPHVTGTVAHRLRVFGACKCICCVMLLCLAASVIWNYQGRLLSLVILPPSHPPITSFDELSKSELRIVGNREEFNSYEFNMRVKYASVFRLTDLPSALIRQRNSLDTSFGYTVPYTKWRLYAKQQEYSTRPLFKYSEHLCYYKLVPYAIVLPENSIYRRALNKLILQLLESGVFDFWIDNSFYDMVKAGRLSYKNLSPPRLLPPLALDDFSGLFSWYGVGLLISLLAFFVELIIFYVNAFI